MSTSVLSLIKNQNQRFLAFLAFRKKTLPIRVLTQLFFSILYT
jgi:hypothetical protein